MSLAFQINIKPNIHPATVRRIVRDAESIVDGLPFLTDCQAAHIRPALPGVLPAVRRLAREVVSC